MAGGTNETSHCVPSQTDQLAQDELFCSFPRSLLLESALAFFEELLDII